MVLGLGAIGKGVAVGRGNSLTSFRAGLGDTSLQYVTVYRGDKAGTTIIKSNAAKELGYAGSQKIIERGNLEELFANHAFDSKIPASPFISVTNDLRVARHFAGPNGVVHEFRIPVTRATPNKLNDYVIPRLGISESELLVPNYIRPNEFVRRH